MIVTFDAAPWVRPLPKRLLEIDVVEVLCEVREATEQSRQFRLLGNAPTYEQIVYCFILVGDREPQGGYGEIQFAVTRLARFVGRQQTL
jgi:hypothetical protein